jgi:hypothetical protein
MLSAVRTTITIQPSLFERLKLFSREHGKTMSEVIETGVREVIQRQESNRLDQMYRTLRQMDGQGEPGITDASTTIDEILYGDTGAWKGMSE